MKRYDLFAQTGMRNLDGYNKYLEKEISPAGVYYLPVSDKYEKKEVSEIILQSRESLKITGVSKMHSLDVNLFDLATNLGRLKVEGKNMEMLSLDIEQGVLLIKGYINKIYYLDVLKEKESFLGKIFK